MNMLKPFLKASFTGLFVWMILTACTHERPCKIEGELKTWHTVTISFPGPAMSEQDDPNPFLNYRLNVLFRSETDSFLVPGFYAADGNASESGAREGNIWQVRFKPDRPGDWTFEASFRYGHNVAVDDDEFAGEPVGFDGMKGEFSVTPSDKTGRDFRAHGRLEYVGERYLLFAGSGDYFIKGGADSPENFLAYHEFDGTRFSGNSNQREGEDSPNTGMHRYTAHVKDWNQGDPVWQGDKGKGIIGALNYLASEGMNSVYFLTMNVLGDGDDVWPWTVRDERYRFDCSKLDQWEVVFDHMEQVGIMMHVVLQETENECLLDAGRLDVQRKLYLRELIARFSHHLAITWNIGEENGPDHWTPVGQTVDQRKEMMSYIRKTSPYNSFIVVHTHSADPVHSDLITPFLGFKDMDGPSMQLFRSSIVHEFSRKWIDQSATAGKQWVVCFDELGQAWKGVMPDQDDPGHDTVRSEALWGNLMAGGAGVEWYFGYHYDHADLNCEDWRSREKMWKQTDHALTFFRDYLPFHEMQGHDELVNSGYCFANPGKVYAIYLPKGDGVSLDLTNHQGAYSMSWYDPTNGGTMVPGEKTKITGGSLVDLGRSPEPRRDWVCLVRKRE
ncbi:MAG: DUF5060 domain-containing protein [Bacteroidota bacterium]